MASSILEVVRLYALPFQALTRNATDAMKESRVADILNMVSGLILTTQSSSCCFVLKNVVLVMLE